MIPQTLDTPPTNAEQILSENPVGLGPACRLLPPGRGGKPICPATLTRWILAGSVGADGRRHRLEGIRVGSKWVTSAPALTRFLDACSAPAAAAGPGPRSPAERTRAQLRAAAELDAAGV